MQNTSKTSLEIKVRAGSAAAAHDAETAVLGEITRLSKILSGYDSDSEFSRWMRSAPVPTKVSPELVEVLSAFDDWRARTSAALDPAVESVSQVWTRAARDHRLPTKIELDLALAQVRQRTGSSIATRRPPRGRAMRLWCSTRSPRATSSIGRPAGR